MFVYVVLNTMIWTVVHFTNGRITPTNYEEKEVYNWAMNKKDMPKWMRKIANQITGNDMLDDGHRQAVELVDSDSTIRNSSHTSSAEDKDVIMLDMHPKHRHHMQNSGYQH